MAAGSAYTISDIGWLLVLVSSLLLELLMGVAVGEDSTPI